MDIITLDFETYYDQSTFTLKKLTTEEYVRDPRFQVIGVGVKLNDEPTQWGSGTRRQIDGFLRSLPWDNAMLLCHNTRFDGFILSEQFGIHARRYLDTMSMAKGLHGFDAPASLDALAKRYGVGVKGTEVVQATGKRREDFTPEELARYGDYCVNDVELTYEIFKRMMEDGFPKQELQLIDLTIKMFVRPRLVLDTAALASHLSAVTAKKEELLSASGYEKSELMSNPKMAALLQSFDVEPPMKTSPTTGKPTYAFAKSDEAFKELLEHEDDRVQAIVSARLGVKSTLEETRTQRFLDMGQRGAMPVPLQYYAAHTGRWGGSDKINLQNLPSRGPNAKKIKQSILAPEGHYFIDSDSSQIEARVLAWLSQQEDLVTAFSRGQDVYKIMASAIYNKAIEDITEGERQIGKLTILGAGYGMGAMKFRAQLKTYGVILTEDEAAHIIRTYRETYPHVVQLWRNAQNVIEQMVQGVSIPFGRPGVIGVEGAAHTLRFPSGLPLTYKSLKATQNEQGKTEYVYTGRYGVGRIYGGKLVENVCQGIARCIIGEQMIRISKRYDVVMTVHDSVGVVVPDARLEAALDYIEECMRWVPAWAAHLPVDCEAKYGRSYAVDQKRK